MVFSSISQLHFWKTYFTPNRYSLDKIPDQSGKVAIVTGANTGLGYITTVALAANGAHVFLACRSEERATNAIERAKAEIKEKYPNATDPKLEFLELDLNDMSKTQRAAKTFLDRGLPLHLLICNSGIMTTPFELSADGIETQFAVNYMGHFLFTMTLLDRIKESQPSRIVNISSIVHEFVLSGGIDFDTLNDETKSDTITRYARSKLANILFTKALARRLEKERVYVNAVHPGVIQTGITRHSMASFGAFGGAAIKRIFNAMAMAVGPKDGSLTQLYAATSPEIEDGDLRGRYFIPIANEILPSGYARDEKLQEKLWDFSENLVKEKIGGI